MPGRLGRWAIVVALLAGGCHRPVPYAGPPAAAADQTDVWFMQHMVPHLWHGCRGFAGRPSTWRSWR